MNTNLAILAGFFSVIAALFLINKDEKEGFEAVGLVYNRPPEWFNKATYRPSDWLVAYYPQQIGQPECMTHSRGDPRELNYLSSAYRFWRM